MFAKLDIFRLILLSHLLAFRIALLGLRVRVRETAYHLLTRFAYRIGAVAYAFDPEDEDTKAAIDAAVEKAIGGLQTKNRELLAKLRKAEKGSEIDPAEVERLESELETLKGQLSDANKALKTATKAAEDVTKQFTAEQAFNHRLLIENGLTAELTAAGVTSPHLLKAALAMIQLEHKPGVVAEGENRVAKIGDKPLADFVKEWAGSDAGKTFVSAGGNSGGGASGGKGAGGGDGANPWAKDSFNLTKQSELYSTNPTQARALAAEAGVTLP